MTTPVVDMADFAVEIDGERYKLTDIPAADSAVVRSAREGILQSLRLDKVITGLSRIGDLINLARHAIPHKYGELKAPVDKLQDHYGSLCGACETELEGARHTTRSIIPNLRSVFRFLLEGKEDIAVRKLTRCAEKAQDLGNRMDRLADRFDAMADNAGETLQDAVVTRGIELRNAEKLVRQTKDLEAKTGEAEVLAEKLAEARTELQRLYAEAKEKAESAEDRAFALNMVSAILKPIAEGVGAFAGAYTRAQDPIGNLRPPPTPEGKGSKTKGKTSKKKDDKATKGKSKEELEVDRGRAETVLGKKKKALEKARKARKEAQQELSKAKAALKAAGKAERQAKGKSAKTKATKARVDAETAVDDAKNKLGKRKGAETKAESSYQKAQREYDTVVAALNAASQALDQMATNIDESGRDYTAIAMAYRQEKLKFFDLMMQKQDLERQALAGIKRYAIEMKNLGEQKLSTEVVAAALFQAIGALRKVVVILREAALFWHNMAEHCHRLATPEMLEDIADYKDLDPKEKHELYSEHEFKVSVVRYIAGWVALELVADEYRKASAGVRVAVRADQARTLSEREGRALAESMASRVLDDVNADIVAIDAMKQALDDARSETETEQREAA